MGNPFTESRGKSKMNLLLDSHALLWALIAPEKLNEGAQIHICNPKNTIFFSAGSVWELELKSSKGKLQLPPDWVETAIGMGLSELPVGAGSAKASTRLPWHHKDPFDRLLIAQALEYKLTLATRDAFASLYGVPILSV